MRCVPSAGLLRRPAGGHNIIYTMSLLCAVPVRWPLSPSAELAVDTWLAECDSGMLAVSRAQLAHRNVSSIQAAGGKRIAVIATHEDHATGKLDAWLPVRAALAHAASLLLAERTADWLVIAEDDAYLSIPRLRSFLAAVAPSVPKFFGACACGRCPGAFVLSAAAVRLHSNALSVCPPDHKSDRYSRGLGYSDRSIFTCLASTGLACTSARSAAAGARDALVSVMASQSERELLRLVSHVASGRRFCSALYPCEGGYECWGAGTWAFHGKPLKRRDVMMQVHTALIGRNGSSRASREPPTGAPPTPRRAQFAAALRRHGRCTAQVRKDILVTGYISSTLGDSLNRLLPVLALASKVGGTIGPPWLSAYQWSARRAHPPARAHRAPRVWQRWHHRTR